MGEGLKLKRKISFGVFFGSIALIVTALSGLIIYPLLIKSGSKEIAGLWFFFTSFSVIISLAEAGLAPIVMRRAANSKVDGTPQVLADYYMLIKKSFRIVTMMVILICLTIYFSYVHWVLLENPKIFYQGLIAWCFFTGANVLTVSNVRNFYMMNGFGEVGWDKVTQIIISLFTVAGYFISLKFGFGLIGLSVVFFLSAILYTVVSAYLLKKFAPPEIFLIKGVVTRNDIIEIFKEGGQVLILSMISILVINKDIFLVERFSGLTTLPLFSALNRIQGIISSVSFLIPQMILPFIAQSYAQQDYKKTHKLYWQLVVLAMVVAFIICIISFFSAGTLIPLWIGKGNYLGNSIFGLMLLFSLLVIHHNAHSSAIISVGANYFMWPAIINALLSVPLSIIGIKYYGIEGMLIGNIIATIFPSAYVVYYSITFITRLKKVQITTQSISNL